ncbi:foldase protein PrsA [Chloroflexus sp.]|uniref:peptidylprolyl isomerase n=1 Tax=Chloroflexus sp. TaxID=1904827 RepID=UPI003D0B405C
MSLDRFFVYVVSLVLAASLVLTACGAPSGPTVADSATNVPSAPTTSASPATVSNAPEGAIARIGDEYILRQDFDRFYLPGGDVQTLVNQMIDVELVVQAARQEGAMVDETVVDAQVEQLRLAQAGGDDAKFAEFLQSNNIADEAELRRLLRRDQLIEQMLLKHTTAEQVRARHILVAATPEEAESRKATAEAILTELRNGADFAALARTRSDDPGSAAQGGDLGWAPRGVYVAPFEEAIFSMQPGELRLVQTDFGWHIIEVTGGPEVRSFEDRALLDTPAGQEAFSATFLPWVAELRSAAEAAGKIEILVDLNTLVQQ